MSGEKIKKIKEKIKETCKDATEKVSKAKENIGKVSGIAKEKCSKVKEKVEEGVKKIDDSRKKPLGL